MRASLRERCGLLHVPLRTMQVTAWFVECAPLLGCPHALAHGKKEAVNKLAEIEHRLRVSDLPQEVMIGAMKVHYEVEVLKCPKDICRGCCDSPQLDDCCMQALHRSWAVVIFASGERACHDQMIGLVKSPLVSKADLAVVQGLGFREQGLGLRV